MKVLDKKDLDGFLSRLAQESRVFVPADVSEGVSQFVPYEQVHSGQASFLWEQNTTVPPKTLYLPQSEAIYAFKAQGKSLAIAEIPQDGREQVIFAMRHCDAQGIACLDKVFLDERFLDGQYANKRAQTIVFALRCNAPKASCFCTSMDIDPETANPTVADVEMYDLGDVLAFAPLSDKGREAMTRTADLLGEQEVTLPPAAKRQLEVTTAGLPQKLSTMFDDPIWEQYAFKCLGCGTCTYLCPTCHCFDLSNKLRGENGVKLRTWDSCMFPEYTQMAGGHNPRPSKKERVRNRFLHKLEYFNERHGMFLCVGCGRCLQKCPMNIDITKFIRQVAAREVQ